MPFASKAQERWMYATHPLMAKKWSKHTKDSKSLPDKKEDRENEQMNSDDPQKNKHSGQTSNHHGSEKDFFDRTKHTGKVVQYDEPKKDVDEASLDEKGFDIKKMLGLGGKQSKDDLSRRLKGEPKTDAPAAKAKSGAEKKDEPKKQPSIMAPKEKTASPEAGVTKKSTIDMAKLRDPEGFVDSVHGFVNTVDHDIETLKHFSNTMSKSKGMDKTPKLDMLKVTKDLNDLQTAMDKPMSKLGQDLKGVGNRLQKKNTTGQGADVRSADQKAKDTKAWQSSRVGLRR